MTSVKVEIISTNIKMWYNCVHYIESIDKLNKELATQLTFSRRKSIEMEFLKANMRKKDDKINGEIQY